MRNLFTSSTIQNNNDRPVVRNITGDYLEDNLAGASSPSWLNDPIGAGLQNTQQLLVDWDDFSKHVFFNSAEAKVNLAFDQIVNGYPFDGTADEKRMFLSSIGGYTKWVLDQIDTHRGYFNFSMNLLNEGSACTHLEVIDQTGYIAPDLAAVVGDARATKDMNTNGSTHECWVYVPDDGGTMTSTQYAVLYQKSKDPSDPNTMETKEAVTIWHTNQYVNPNDPLGKVFDVHFMIGSGDFKSIKHQITGLETDRWHHIAFVYERATTERVISYRNAQYDSKTEVNQAELDDITAAGGKIRLGWSDIRHVGYASSHMAYTGANNPVPFRGLLDELRVWLGPRTQEKIKRYYKRNVDNQENLLIAYRFNEPSTTTYSYGARSIVLDYSGSSLHTVIKNSRFGQSVTERDRYQVNSVDIEPPVSLERSEDNKILFPDWPPNTTLNQTLLLEGNHYDRNNPNLITNLVPKHYFEEAIFFEGVEKDWQQPKAFGLQVDNAQEPFPGHGQIPSRVVLMYFLLVWANFFDDIKLFIDHFTTIDKVTYDNYNQIPPQLISVLSDYYGINLPDPYTNETPDRYQGGENIEITNGVHIPLKKTIDTMWRRVLINLPFLLRSRGTVQGIRSLFNTLGIEADGLFKLREYGGNLTSKVNSSRRKRKKRVKLLDFSQISYAESNSLWAYRHEPGAPDSGGAPAMASITAQFGDIVYSTPEDPPVLTQYTSGSWSYEGRYTLNSAEDTCSLFRLERDGEILVNVVAHRELDANTNSYQKYGVQLHFDGQKTTSDAKYVELENINLWDSSAWYLQVYHELADNPKIGIRVLKANDRYIVENHHKFTTIEKETSGAPLYTYDATASDTLRYYIGTDSNASYNNPGIYNVANPNTDSEHARVQNYSGRCSHMRFWTKSLQENEIFEHVKNPFSVAVINPISSFAFLNSPIRQYNAVSGIYEEVPLENFSTIYEHGLPDGSWERLRNSFDMLQGETVLDSNGELYVWDTSQNNNHLTIHGDAGNDEVLKTQEMVYNISSADFDFNSASNKVRIRSYESKEKAKENFVHHGKLTKIQSQIGVDDRRFSVECSLVHALSEDMLNITGDADIFNNYLGAPELEYAVEYPEITKVRDLYFERIVGRVNYNSVIEFQRWFNGNFASLVEQFIPHTADFLGINFVIESHLLERHKFEYKQGDVHVDVNDRVAFSQEPLFIGVFTSETT